MKKVLFEIRLSAVRRSTGKLIGITTCVAPADSLLDAVPIVLRQLDTNDFFYDLVDDYYPHVLSAKVISNQRKSKRRDYVNPIADDTPYERYVCRHEYWDTKYRLPKSRWSIGRILI